MTKTEELLKVLDMTNKAEQAVWCEGQNQGDRQMGESLADLAFRLRDEVLKSENGTIKWVAGMFDVYVYMKMTGSKLLNWRWGYVKAQPIHWIIAALIAKIKERRNEDI